MTDIDKRIAYPAHNRLKRQLDKTYCEQGSASYNEEAEQILSEFNNMRVKILELQAQVVERETRIARLEHEAAVWKDGCQLTINSMTKREAK